MRKILFRSSQRCYNIPNKESQGGVRYEEDYYYENPEQIPDPQAR